MSRAVRLFAVPLIALGFGSAAADEPKKTDQVPLSEQTALLPAIQVDSLALTPIVATEVGLPKKDLDVVTLDEAFAQKLVSIKEQESESVNHLTLTNKANRPMFVLAGEVIIGGKQDRIIGANTILAANTTVVVPVFCVEHGRWDSGQTFTTGHALAHGRLRGQASFENQSEVWREVAAKNAIRKTENSTGTYRQVAQQQTGGTLGTSEKKVQAALAKILPDDRARMVGYVVSLNGKVATIDMFESPKLFRKLEDKLVRSYLTDSIDTPVDRSAKPPTVGEVKAFMADADKARAEKTYESPMATTIRYKGAQRSNKAVVDFNFDDDAVASPSPSAPKKSKQVYKTYQMK